MCLESMDINITAHQIDDEDTQSGSIIVGDLVEAESKISPDVKQAVNDFIEQQMHRLNDVIGEFVINIPEELIQLRK